MKFSLKITLLILLAVIAPFSLAQQPVPDSPGNEVKIELIGANPSAAPMIEFNSCPPSYFFRGVNAASQRSEVSGSASLISSFRDIYPGIDLIVYGDGYGLEYIFLVRNGGDPEQIRMFLKGESPLEAGTAGSFVQVFDNTETVLSPPVAFLVSDNSTQPCYYQ